MNLPSKLGRLGKAHASLRDASRTRTFAGFGIVGLVVAGFVHLPTSDTPRVVRAIARSTRNSQVADRTTVLPLVAPIASSEPTSDRADLTTTKMAAKERQNYRLNSAQIALEEAKVAVSLSQAQLAQARINLVEFRAKHDNAKILAAQGQVSRQQADTAKAAHKLAQLQHSSASIGLQESQAQLIAAKAEVGQLGCKANSAKQM